MNKNVVIEAKNNKYSFFILDKKKEEYVKIDEKSYRVNAAYSIYFDGVIHCEEQNFSQCIPPYSCNFIGKLNSRGANFLIGVGYTDKNNFKDFQMCVTGKIKKEETESEAAIREIREELGLDTKEKNLEHGSIARRQDTYYMNFFLDLKKCRLNNLKKSMRSCDDKYNRIAVWIYASREEDLGILKKIKYNNKIQTSDKTSFISVVSIQQAKIMSEWISKNYRGVFSTHKLEEVRMCKKRNCVNKKCRYVHL